MSKFTVTRLLGNEYLIEGTDLMGVHGSTVQYSEAYNDMVRDLTEQIVNADFSAEVEAFFQPITTAAQAARQLLKNDSDPENWHVVVTQKGVKEVEQVEYHLDKAGTLIRLAEVTDGDMLRWINGELVALLP